MHLNAVLGVRYETIKADRQVYELVYLTKNVVPLGKSIEMSLIFTQYGICNDFLVLKNYL